MATLYVETNFAMGIAMGQDVDAPQLLSSFDSGTHTLVVPAVCLMEAMSAFQGKRREHNVFTRQLQDWARELQRDRTSAHAASMSTAVQQAKVSADQRMNDIQSRLVQCIALLCRNAEVIATSADTIVQSTRAPHLKQMTDNLILHAVLGDAAARVGRKALLTGNTKDFSDPAIVQLLAAADVAGPFPNAASAAAWLAAAP